MKLLPRRTIVANTPIQNHSDDFPMSELAVLRKYPQRIQSGPICCAPVTPYETPLGSGEDSSLAERYLGEAGY